MQKLFIAGAALLGLTQAVTSETASKIQSQNGGYGHGYGDHPSGSGLTSDRKGRIEYDYDCRADALEDSLQNGITLYGPHVVLINLDNRCQVEKYEREGVFLHTGDLLFVTGREYTCAW